MTIPRIATLAKKINLRQTGPFILYCCLSSTTDLEGNLFPYYVSHYGLNAIA